MMMVNNIPLPAKQAQLAAHSILDLPDALTIAWAPGRMNIIGEHTDYNDGFVLPVAIERVVAMAGVLSNDPAERFVRLYSAQYDSIAAFSLDALPTADNPQDVPLWARYIAGVLVEMRARGMPTPAFSAAIAGDVPLGSGMSSSAALLIAAITWILAATGQQMDPLEQAKLGQLAELHGSGVRVGILDQAASVLGKPHQAILIDCRSLEYRAIPLNLPNIDLLSCETGVERSLASSGYNQRRQECEDAVQRFRRLLVGEGDTRTIASLRDVTHRDLLRLGGYMPATILQRMRHVVTENERVFAAAQALAAGDDVLFGSLLLESHASLRDDYAVSCLELDAVVDIATRAEGALGARLVGAGFGGSALIAVHRDQTDAVIARLTAEYPLRTGKTPVIHRVVPAGGPRWVKE